MCYYILHLNVFHYKIQLLLNRQSTEKYANVLELAPAGLSLTELMNKNPSCPAKIVIEQVRIAGSI